MQMLRTFCKYRVILLAGLFFISWAAKAGDGGGVVKAMAVLDGSLHQIHADSSRTVQDSAFFNPAYVGNLDPNYTVQNIVTVKINEASTALLKTNFTVVVKCRISYTTSTGDTASFVKDFTVKYDTLAAYDGRVSFTFNGARRVKVTVLSVNSNVTGWDPVRALIIENQLITKPKFLFSCSNTVGSIVVSPSVDTADELPVSWSAVLGADMYDLEWTYIDTSALKNGVYNKIPFNTSSPLDLVRVFANGSSRVTISGTGYNIPLLYDDSGTLFVRVRPIQIGDKNKVTAATWSSEATTPVYARYAFVGHQRNLNWQSNISFAEEGKRKMVVQYFDGSLRSRQTVTKDNTTNTTVVAETFYDKQGRAAIQVLPSPTMKSIIRYTAGFNRSINFADYSAADFDTVKGDAGLCDIHGAAMDSSSGASNYYSANNPRKTQGLNQFIPTAEGFPFTETEYTPDNTGRISRQGGVGPEYQVASGHETKYYYGTPDQNELDGLFGTEVGDRSHYFKNMVRDANGQYSVSYVDMHGRTIATGLTGSAPSSVTPLSSNVQATVTEKMADSASSFLQGLTMTSQKSLLVSVADSFRFHYSLMPDIFRELNCINPVPICYSCRYDLEISITDDCHNQHLPNQRPYDTVIHNFKVGGITNSCNDSLISLDFNLFLQEGSYLVTKKLTPDQDAYAFYRDSVYLPGNTCTDLQKVINQQSALIQIQDSTCSPSCSTCKAKVADWPTFLQNFITHAGLHYPADTAAYRPEALTAYNNAVAACELICGEKTSDVDDIRNAMLQDLTPPFGQYADTSQAVNKNKYSIFYQRNDDTAYVPIYRLPAVDYLDEVGRPDSIYSERWNMMVEPNSLSVPQFTQNFRASWAEALLPYHPEYCKLLALQAEAASGVFDRQMEETDTYTDALNKGYLNAMSGTHDPLFLGHADLKQMMTTKMAVYITKNQDVPALSIWGLATSTVACPTGDKSCVQQYSTATSISSSMCDGDRNLAWQKFREYYLTYKHDILFQKLIDQPAGCLPRDTRAVNKTQTAEQLYTDSCLPRFTDTKTNLNRSVLKDYLKVSSPSQASTATGQTTDSLNSAYDQNCRSFTATWIQQLTSSCKVYNNYNDLRTVLIPKLYTLCRAACDATHPYGASTLPPGVSYPGGASYRSFQDIIADYNSSHGLTDDLHCNAELITAPAPYDQQTSYAEEPISSRPSDCECNLLNTQFTMFRLARRDASFSAYLKRTQNITMSESDLNTLRSLCAGNPATATCKNLTTPIALPPALQCGGGTTAGGSACKDCQTVRDVYNGYVARYPTLMPKRDSLVFDSVQVLKNRLFENYMNNRLGFTKQTYEYLNFIDTCDKPGGGALVKDTCLWSIYVTQYYTGGQSSITDVHQLPNKGFIMAGKTTATDAGMGDWNAYIQKTDSAGNLVWGRIIGGAGYDEFTRVKTTSDSGYIAIGTTKNTSNPTGAFLIVRLDSLGKIKWTRTIGYNTTNGDWGMDVIQTKDGGFAAVGTTDLAPTVSNILALKMDTAGAIKWVRKFGFASSDITGSLIENNDTIIVSGDAWRGDAYVGVLYHLNEADSGRIIKKWMYEDHAVKDTSLYIGTLFKSDSGYFLNSFSGYRAASTDGRQVAFKIGLDGRVKSASRFQHAAGANYANGGNVLPTLDGGCMAITGDTIAKKIYWQKLTSKDSVAWTKGTSFPGKQTVGSAIQRIDTGYAIAGVNNDSVFLLLTDSGGYMGCWDSTVLLGASRITVDTLSSIMYAFLDSNKTKALTNLAAVDSAAKSLYQKNLICASGVSTCYRLNNGPTLCGSSPSVYQAPTPTHMTTCSDSTFFAVSKGTVIYNYYTDSLTGSFEKNYMKTCLNARTHETFTVTHTKREYHYTLYYYDQAGNLIKTVPPAGVMQITDSVELSLVRAARAANSVKVPAHTLATNYRYNTLNQISAQLSPDGGTSHFWYDRLDRLSISQNARQKTGNKYSYTLYDSIGRVIQVGQLTSLNAMTNEISQNEAALQSWISSAAHTAEQISVTSYDTVSEFIEPAIKERNIRNRVSRTALYNVISDLDEADGYATATYYSYDILGNVDTIMRDFNAGVMQMFGNRFKKIAYNYDMYSGKVDKVIYQGGLPDAFYHSYIYDAENRITNVQSSTDSINWDNEAWYSYYLHGPLARTVIGEQQVQGINYAYTLQGRLKAINPDVYIGSGYTLRPDSMNNVVAASAYSELINYYNADFKPITGQLGADAGISTRLASDYHGLFNGNISSVGTRIRGLNNSLLYNYRYDQLNRLVQMDAYNKSGSAWKDLSPLDDFKEQIAYDGNGNILQYKRNGNNTFAGKPIAMDNMVYFYNSGTNKLDHIYDSVPAANYDADIDVQSSGNYQYDEIGQLKSDANSGIDSITWTAYGKIARIKKSGDTVIQYTYDASSNRISKSLIHGADTITTWYVRDVRGNVLSIYTYGDPEIHGRQLTQTELNLYGVSRLGIQKRDVVVALDTPMSHYAIPLLGLSDSITFMRGKKFFELSNHLDNVLATVSDRRYGITAQGDSNVMYFVPDLVSANDYYPFGAIEYDRSYKKAGSNYRYGFNGKEKDDDIKGDGNVIDYGMRVYDPRVGRFMSVDPLTKSYPWYTPYQYAGNGPIQFIDADGEEEANPSLLRRAFNAIGGHFELNRLDKYLTNHNLTSDDVVELGNDTYVVLEVTKQAETGMEITTYSIFRNKKYDGMVHLKFWEHMGESNDDIGLTQDQFINTRVLGEEVIDAPMFGGGAKTVGGLVLNGAKESKLAWGQLVNVVRKVGKELVDWKSHIRFGTLDITGLSRDFIKKGFHLHFKQIGNIELQLKYVQEGEKGFIGLSYLIGEESQAVDAIKTFNSAMANSGFRGALLSKLKAAQDALNDAVKVLHNADEVRMAESHIEEIKKIVGVLSQK